MSIQLFKRTLTSSVTMATVGYLAKSRRTSHPSAVTKHGSVGDFNELTGEKSSTNGSELRMDEDTKIKIPRDLREEDFDEEDYVLNEKVLSHVERLLYCTNPYSNSNEPAHETYNSSFAPHSHSLPQLPIYSYAPSFRSDLKYNQEEDELSSQMTGALSLQMSESEANEVEFSLGSSTSSSSSDLTKTTKSKESKQCFKYIRAHQYLSFKCDNRRFQLPGRALACSMISS